MTPEQATALRAPFPPETIGKRPQPLQKDSPKGRCQECGGYHGLPAIHLDYVGHAATTNRLLEVDPEWTWAPMAKGPNGEPLLTNNGLWITLTVCGVTRPGFGDGASPKEIIGDAIRNAAMRFGVALDLWSKEDLSASVAGEPAAAPAAATEEPPVDMNDPSIPFGDAPPPPREKQTVTQGMKTALDTLVGKLRDEGGYITTEQLYGAIATLRGLETDELILQIGGVDGEGVLRWRRLRDSLLRPEAQQLREWLARKQAQLETEAEQSPFTPPAGIQVPFDE